MEAQYRQKITGTTGYKAYGEEEMRKRGEDRVCYALWLWHGFGQLWKRLVHFTRVSRALLQLGMSYLLVLSRF